MTGAVEDLSASGDSHLGDGWLTDPDDVELLKIDPRWAVRRAAARGLRDLAAAVTRGDIGLKILQALEQQITQWCVRLANQPKINDRIEYLSGVNLSGPSNRLALELSAVVGRSNPSSLPLEMAYGENGLVGRLTPTLHHEGPPGFLHGGIIAAMFDEFLGLAQTQLQRPPAMTATLSVRYLKPTPIDRVLEMRLCSITIDGRKRIAAGGLWAGDEQTAACDAIFVATRA